VESYRFDFAVIEPIFPDMLRGLGLSIALAGLVMLLSLPLGLLVALLRMAPIRALNAMAYVYIEALRTTPLLVLVSWFYFVPRIAYQIAFPAFATAVLAYTLNLSAFLADVFRGSILSIDPGQREAALATGMTTRATMRRIILPQAVMRSVPVIASYWVSLFKDTSLVAVIGVQDLMYVARAQAVITYRPLEILTVAALLYFCLTYPQSLLVNRMFERLRVIE
jgi:polar amino acid transport system permease protein